MYFRFVLIRLWIIWNFQIESQFVSPFLVNWPLSRWSRYVHSWYLENILLIVGFLFTFQSRLIFVNIFLVVGFCAIFVVCDKLTEEECSKLGFNKAELWCDRCSELRKFELDELKDSCLKCCKEDDKNSRKVGHLNFWTNQLSFSLFVFLCFQKYAYARLEYCECNIANFPQVKGLIEW